MVMHDAAVAATRFGFGLAFGGDDALAPVTHNDLIDQTRRAPSTDHPAFAGLRPVHDLVREFMQVRERGGDPAIIELFRGPFRQTYLDEATARLKVAAGSRDGLHERLVHLWSNHFTVSARKPIVGGLAGAFEREAIRPHVTGRFADLLVAVVRHPTMILYLDNAQSFGPNSRGGRYTGIGMNENLAREILELHTIGVDGGYAQADVAGLARMLTGWSLGRPGKSALPGGFLFHEVVHEPGDHVLLGKAYADEGAMQAERALRDLAALPQTARRVALRLARHFVADAPPQDLLERLTGTYLDTGGDLGELTRMVLADDRAWQPQTKLKTPNDLVVSTLRALGPASVNRGAVLALSQLGQPAWAAPSPQGWADEAGAWLSPDQAMKRIEFAVAIADRLGDRVAPDRFAGAILGTQLRDETRDAVGRAESRTQGMAMILAAPEFQRR
ncbi:MAG: DUF1800 domain-containing protein [Pseudomonadota bacterium]|nr:DUF1800 domain-containing protein [Pseudomonadota bacterium]